MTRRNAERIISAIKTQREGATDAVASESIPIYPTLKGDGRLITAGTRINWSGQLKRAAADLWDSTENSPDNAPTLWNDIAYHNGHRIIPNPEGGTFAAALAFSAGETGYWPLDGGIYTAVNNGTVWTPAAYPAGWRREN